MRMRAASPADCSSTRPRPPKRRTRSRRPHTDYSQTHQSLSAEVRAHRAPRRAGAGCLRWSHSPASPPTSSSATPSALPGAATELQAAPSVPGIPKRDDQILAPKTCVVHAKPLALRAGWGVHQPGRASRRTRRREPTRAWTFLLSLRHHLLLRPRLNLPRTFLRPRRRSPAHLRPSGLPPAPARGG